MLQFFVAMLLVAKNCSTAFAKNAAVRACARTCKRRRQRAAAAAVGAEGEQVNKKVPTASDVCVSDSDELRTDHK